MNKKYIILFYNKLYFKEILFRKLIDYYINIKDYEVLLITNIDIKIDIQKYTSLTEVFKNTFGEYLILNKIVYFDNLKELENIKNNIYIYKNNTYIGKYIIDNSSKAKKYHFKNNIHIINNYFDLYKLNKKIQIRFNKKLIKKGINIIDPYNTYISTDSKISKNTIIYPNTYINSSSIGSNCNIGPMANIKKNCFIGDNCRIGNFVEIKNSRVENNTKIAHHTYIGDSIIGKNVNIGCGVVTCNYDGFNKKQVIIKDRSFIGSNVNLIAPVTIGYDTYIASGSTIYNNIDNFDFAIARSYQVNKKGYSIKYPYYQKFFSENLSEE